MSNGFKIVPDKYFRGNGRWSKVTRQHDKVGEPVNGRQQWKAKYCVACDIDGQHVARQTETYAKRVTAESVAKDWIDFGA